ncbi:hypothetical protein [Aquabacterium humicola]|uniref:hypothetical protein n=1 Tax=Aquabacterium humicola TaxID=3237377 RepID=UPI002543B4BA|nr:hypothetical protein [Rubrivivax pictus]
MSVRPVFLFLPVLAAALAAALSGCGSSPSASDSAPAKPSAPALYTRSLTGAAAAAAVAAAMDDADLRRLGAVIEKPQGGPGRWTGARGHDFVVTPVSSFAGDHGTCGEFLVDATRNGATERWRASACQQADRRWQVLR